jgi:hypothetical protein
LIELALELLAWASIFLISSFLSSQDYRLEPWLLASIFFVVSF